MKRTYICTVCPVGCEIEAEYENDTVLSVKGNTCKRGEQYVKAELTNPVRTLTTTVRREDGKIISVRTDEPIPRRLMLDAMTALNSMRAPKGAKPGDILTQDLLGLNISVSVTGVPEI